MIQTVKWGGKIPGKECYTSKTLMFMYFNKITSPFIEHLNHEKVPNLNLTTL